MKCGHKWTSACGTLHILFWLYKRPRTRANVLYEASIYGQRCNACDRPGSIITYKREMSRVIFRFFYDVQLLFHRRRFSKVLKTIGGLISEVFLLKWVTLIRATNAKLVFKVFVFLEENLPKIKVHLKAMRLQVAKVIITELMDQEAAEMVQAPTITVEEEDMTLPQVAILQMITMVALVLLLIKSLILDTMMQADPGLFNLHIIPIHPSQEASQNRDIINPIHSLLLSRRSSNNTELSNLSLNLKWKRLKSLNQLWSSKKLWTSKLSTELRLIQQ